MYFIENYKKKVLSRTMCLKFFIEAARRKAVSLN